MNTKHNAFTLLELLAALTISSFVVTGMIQGFRNVQNVLLRSRQLLQLNREVCLLFNQMERDFNTAYIIQESQPVTKDEKKQPEKPAGKRQSQFVATIYENETQRIAGKNYPLFKSVNFINTNPLQVWGTHKIRQIRVGYFLEKDKEKSTQTITSYTLYRKETEDIKNTQLKQDEEAEKAKKTPLVYTATVATQIKSLYIEYVIPKEKIENEEEPEKKSFIWGEKKEEQDNVPQYVIIIITLWNNDFTKDNTFSFICPIFSYPTPKPEKPRAKKPDEKKTSQQPGEKSPGGPTTQSATPPKTTKTDRSR